MRPRGDGDREKSLQDFFNRSPYVMYGERWPLVCGGRVLPFPLVFDFGTVPEEVLVVSPDMRLRLVVLARIGERDRVRARFSREESLSWSSASWIVSGCGDFARWVFRATDLVKYPSDSGSLGVGEGEITRGVEGIGFV